MVRIRRANVDDSDRIAAVHVRTWQAAYVDVLPASYRAASDPAEWAARHRRRSKPGTGEESPSSAPAVTGGPARQA